MRGLQEDVVRFVTGETLVPLAVLAVAYRFAAPTLTAGIGVSGIDTRPIDAVFSAYTGILPIILLLLATMVLAAWPGGFRRSPASVVAGLLLLGTAIQWLGQADARLRLFASPWTGLVLGASAAATLVVWEAVLDRALRDRGAGENPRSGQRAFGFGFAGAFLLSSLRLVDYGHELGTPLPLGLVWFLDYSPALLLSFLAIGYWVELVLVPARLPGEASWTFGPVLVLALLGLALSYGFGGFLLSNALTWGGGYAVFAPTSVSLTIVGAGAGAFLAVAVRLRGRMDRPAWRAVVGGILVAALSGITPFGGVLPSLAGIFLGLTLAALGLVSRASGEPKAAE